jgi:hypothetical protein
VICGVILLSESSSIQVNMVVHFSAVWKSPLCSSCCSVKLGLLVKILTLNNEFWKNMHLITSFLVHNLHKDHFLFSCVTLEYQHVSFFCLGEIHVSKLPVIQHPTIQNNSDLTSKNFKENWPFFIKLFKNKFVMCICSLQHCSSSFLTQVSVH